MNINDKFIFDFDGVICDSSFECFVVSYFVIKDMPPEMFSESLLADLQSSDDWNLFKELRPLGTNGCDFLILCSGMYELSKNALRQAVMQNTDRNIDQVAGAPFYQMRTKLKQHDFHLWLSLNRLYETSEYFIKSLLKGDHSPLTIVTTKDSQSVSDILQFHGFTADQLSIYGREQKKTKKNQIADIRSQWKGCQLHFIEDSLENLKSCLSLEIKLYLATWGYVDHTMRVPPSITKLNSFKDLRIISSG